MFSSLTSSFASRGREPVRVELARPETSFLAMIEPRTPGIDAVSWCRQHAGLLKETLHQCGSLMLRNFSCNIEGFEAIADLFATAPSSRRGQVSPRHQVQGTVYTSTDLPQNHGICQHQEMAYDLFPPRYIMFYCKTAPLSGGETPVADARELYRRLDRRLIERFTREGVLYLRNFPPDSPYQSAEETFLFEDRAELDRYARDHAIDCEWVDDAYLRTRQHRSAIAVHPDTGDQTFFNLAHLWHWSYIAEVATAFSAALADKVRSTRGQDQWYNAFYGTGEDIEQSAIADIHGHYGELEVAIPWQEHDILIQDNLLSSHGRRPFDSKREILATIRGPWSTPYTGPLALI